MGNVFEHRVTRGAVRLTRRWEPEDGRPPSRRGGGTNAGREGVSTAGRQQRQFSARSRRAMRYEFSALPWELLGPRPAMVTLTYPAKWRECAPDARAVVRHREALKERWRRRYGAPIGVWVMEFQPRARRAPDEQHAPHVHLYVGLPDMPDAEFNRLRARTLGRHHLEREYGKYEGRRRVKPPEGEFARWLLQAWWEVVGSGDTFHRRRGVDITPAFWSDEAEAAADRTRIADYFWRESGKWGQKTPPEGFGGLAFYGRWGGRLGFEPIEGARQIEDRVFYELRRVYRRYIEGQMRQEAKRQGRKPPQYQGPRGRDGLTAFMRDAVALAGRLQEWAEGEAARKAMAGAR